MKRLTLLMLLFSFSGLTLGEESGTPQWQPGKNGVAWQAKKRFMLFSDQTPVGMNQAVTVSLDQVSGGRRIRVVIPIEKFDSGEGIRDENVRELLKIDENKDLLFLSETLSEDSVTGLTRGTVNRIGGTLRIGRKAWPVAFKIRTVSKGVLEGEFEGTMSQLGVEPPSVVGGIVTKVEDYVKLFVRIHLSSLNLKNQ